MNAVLPRQRGSKDIWLEAAYELLILEGIDAVKVTALAKRLNLTRTGFYWFFKDISELHDAMIQRWEQKNTDSLIARCNADASNICQALFNLVACWHDPLQFDAPLDLAIRNWARVDPDLRVRLRVADDRRIKAVVKMFERHGYAHEQANVRGMTVIYTQIGYISMQIEESKEERLARVPDYIETFAGVAPSKRDVADFIARYTNEGARL